MMAITIFYFGGYRATSSDVAAWANSVQKQNPQLSVTAYPYPTGASAGDPLAEWTQSREVAAKVAERAPAIIIGHSSGCAIANDVAEHALDLGAEFQLIALDGFCPSPRLLARSDTLCWSAKGPNGEHSLNYEALSGTRCFHVYEAKVAEPWPLHFSLVNLNVSDDYDEIADGYRNCMANLEVLNDTKTV
jgi:hypothetical protein